jgi:hypothetical protein
MLKAQASPQSTGNRYDEVARTKEVDSVIITRLSIDCVRSRSGGAGFRYQSLEGVVI